jgi:hypothetical protein
MMKKNAQILVCFLFSLFTAATAQHAPFFFNYQGIARDSFGSPLDNRSISLKIGIISGNPSGTLQWEETHAVTTDKNGLYNLKIGDGASTGNGISVSFATIPWSTEAYFLKVAISYTSGAPYANMGSAQLLSVPYSFYSQKTNASTPYKLSELPDVNFNGVATGHVLIWYGKDWKVGPDNDSDTVNYSKLTAWVPTATKANYLKYPYIISNDTVLFAYKADSAMHVQNAYTVKISHQAVYSDTAFYAKSFLPYNWSVNGNIGGQNSFIGTRDPNPIILKTAALERIRITNSGKFTTGGLDTVAKLHVSGTDGMIAAGIFGLGNPVDSTAGTKFLWYPRKAALCMGEGSANNWLDSKIGNYSFSVGRNTMAAGIYAVAMGLNSAAHSESCISIGNNCTTKITGVVSEGAAIAMGDSSACDFTRGIALGIKCFVTFPAGGIAIGYKNVASGASASAAFGYRTVASGLVSIAFGSYASNNVKQGSFIFGDASTTTQSKNTVANQFMVRASGGVIIYTDTIASMGVELLPGASAWSNIADRNKIENFRSEDADVILKKISNLKIKTWNYKSQDEKTRHIGPTAQHFYSAFSLGDNNVTICTTDMDGVTLLGIKALENKTSKLMRELNKLKELEINTKEDFQGIEKRIEVLEQKLLH